MRFGGFIASNTQISHPPSYNDLLESFYYLTTLNFEIRLTGIPVRIFKVDRLLTDLTAQQIGTTARWCSNKTPLFEDEGCTVQ